MNPIYSSMNQLRLGIGLPEPHVGRLSLRLRREDALRLGGEWGASLVAAGGARGPGPGHGGEECAGGGRASGAHRRWWEIFGSAGVPKRTFGVRVILNMSLFLAADAALFPPSGSFFVLDAGPRCATDQRPLQDR